MVKAANEVWHNSGRKESKVFIRYQYKYHITPSLAEVMVERRIRLVFSVAAGISEAETVRSSFR